MTSYRKWIAERKELGDVPIREGKDPISVDGELDVAGVDASLFIM